jgi:hypothetical protein
MKNFNLQFGGIKEVLTKEQMRKIRGGEHPVCAEEGNAVVNIMCCSDATMSDCTNCLEICGFDTVDCKSWYGPYNCGGH